MNMNLIPPVEGRRRFLQQAGVFAFAANMGFPRLFAQAPRGRAQRCIVLWMNGGPSQLETLDPKPGSVNAGEGKATKTAVPGIHLGAHLPNVAKQMEHLALVRNLESKEGAHERGQYALHTGFSPQPTFPRPSLGAIVSSETPAAPFPKFVSFGSTAFGSAFLGPEHAPWNMGEPAEAHALLQSLQRKGKLLEAISDIGETFAKGRSQPALAARQTAVSRMEAMIETPFVAALNLEQEPQSTLDRYGRHIFGRQCLTARRMLSIGVRFVEVRLDGWDTHQNNFPATRKLCEQLDAPWSALLDDLRSEGLLEETLVVWMGEFGRTPQINATAGRDHFPARTPIAIAGAGIQGGQVVGATDDHGQPAGPARPVADLFATMLAAFGLPPDHTLTTAFDSPTTVTDGGRVIADILS